MPCSGDYPRGDLHDSDGMLVQLVDVGCNKHTDEPANRYTELDKLTQMLCYTCGTFCQYAIPMPSSLLKWWQQHEATDCKRVTEEMQNYIRGMSIAKIKNLTMDKLADSFIKRAEAVHAVSDWHKDYWFPKIADAVLHKRLSEIVVREDALAKLTAAERRVLGLE
jgi:transcription initiation factor TFIIIB Brf1 subunit/transcription initiation factor TFIIB